MGWDWIEEEQILTANVVTLGKRHQRSVHVEATAVPHREKGDLLRRFALVGADDLQPVNGPRHPNIGQACFNHSVRRTDNPRTDNPSRIGIFLP
jgi:hypothetical protein